MTSETAIAVVVGMATTLTCMALLRARRRTLPAGAPSSEAPSRATSNGGSRPAYFLVAVLILVNAVAIWGQAGWAYGNITEPSWDVPLRLALAVGFAAAVELIGVYLSQEADEALMADQPSFALRWGSYAVGMFAGWAQLQHFDGTMAAVFAVLSALSPVLWGVRSRARNRARLAEIGEATRKGVRLSPARRIWHPVRSVRVMSWAAWEGVTSEADAVRGWELTRELPEAPVSPAGGRSAEQWVAMALAHRTANPDHTWEQTARAIGISDRGLRAHRKAVSA